MGARCLRTPPPGWQVRLPVFCSGRYPNTAVGRVLSTEHNASPASGHRNAFGAGNRRCHGPCTRQVRGCTFSPVYFLSGGPRSAFPSGSARLSLSTPAYFRPVAERRGRAPSCGREGHGSARPRPQHGGGGGERRARAALQVRAPRRGSEGQKPRGPALPEPPPLGPTTQTEVMREETR